MKGHFRLLAALTVFLSGSSYAGQSSVELGTLLFHDPALGGSRNEKSCNTCHPDGRGLEQATRRSNLTEVIKSCILGPMDGNRVDARRVDLRSLKMFIESLGQRKPASEDQTE